MGQEYKIGHLLKISFLSRFCLRPTIVGRFLYLWRFFPLLRRSHTGEYIVVFPVFDHFTLFAAPQETMQSGQIFEIRCFFLHAKEASKIQFRQCFPSRRFSAGGRFSVIFQGKPRAPNPKPRNFEILPMTTPRDCKSGPGVQNWPPAQNFIFEPLLFTSYYRGTFSLSLAFFPFVATLAHRKYIVVFFVFDHFTLFAAPQETIQSGQIFEIRCFFCTRQRGLQNKNSTMFPLAEVFRGGSFFWYFPRKTTRPKP